MPMREVRVVVPPEKRDIVAKHLQDQCAIKSIDIVHAENAVILSFMAGRGTCAYALRELDSIGCGHIYGRVSMMSIEVAKPIITLDGKFGQVATIHVDSSKAAPDVEKDIDTIRARIAGVMRIEPSDVVILRVKQRHWLQKGGEHQYFDAPKPGSTPVTAVRFSLSRKLSINPLPELRRVIDFVQIENELFAEMQSDANTDEDVEYINSVFRLRDLGVKGPLLVEDKKMKHGPKSLHVLPVEEIYADIRAGAAFSKDFATSICVASMISTIGLATNNAVMIVASMLVSPLMGPILGFTFGVVLNRHLPKPAKDSEAEQNKLLETILRVSLGLPQKVVDDIASELKANFKLEDLAHEDFYACGLTHAQAEEAVTLWHSTRQSGSELESSYGRTRLAAADLIRMGLRTELYGVLLTLLSGAIVGLALMPFAKTLEWPTDEMKSRGEPISLIVGLLYAIPSGVGVGLSIAEGGVNSLVGVAIAASLLPPVCNSGMNVMYALFGPSVHGVNPVVYWDIALYSFLLFLLNVAVIFLVAGLYFEVKEFRPYTRTKATAASQIERSKKEQKEDHAYAHFSFRVKDWKYQHLPKIDIADPDECDVDDDDDDASVSGDGGAAARPPPDTPNTPGSQAKLLDDGDIEIHERARSPTSIREKVRRRTQARRNVTRPHLHIPRPPPSQIHHKGVHFAEDVIHSSSPFAPRRQDMHARVAELETMVHTLSTALRENNIEVPEYTRRTTLASSMTRNHTIANLSRKDVSDDN